MHKTNAMRMLDQHRIPYKAIEYNHGKNDPVDACSVAASLHEDIACVFKTLVCHHGHDHFVFVIPGAEELDLKKAARAAGTKNMELLPLKDLTKVTGYIRGGCSPFGMKKAFPTFVDESIRELDKVYVSAGKIGMQLEMEPETFLEAGPFPAVPLTKKE